MSFKPEDITGDVEGLSAAEVDVLNDWEAVSLRLVDSDCIFVTIFD